jgi:hypothetical protein
MPETQIEGNRYLEVALSVAEECDVCTWEFRKPLPGESPPGHDSREFARSLRRHVVCPQPTDLESLYVWLQECAHVKYQHDPTDAIYWQEFQASRFAIGELKRHGFPLTRGLLRLAHNHVTEHLDEAMDRARDRKRCLGKWRYQAIRKWLKEIQAKGEALPEAS